MCLICIEFQKGKMTVEEGWRNLSEMEDTITEEHKVEVEEMLWDNWTLAHTAPRSEDVDERAYDIDFDYDNWYNDHGQGD